MKVNTATDQSAEDLTRNAFAIAALIDHPHHCDRCILIGDYVSMDQDGDCPRCGFTPEPEPLVRCLHCDRIWFESQLLAQACPRCDGRVKDV